MNTPLNRLYVQTLDQPLPPQDTDDPARYAEKIERLATLIHKADAVVVGIGSGLSTAAGYDFYHTNPQFEHAFAPFRAAHGFTTLFDGMYHAFSTNEEQWAFTAAVIKFVSELPLGAPYRQLARLLTHKEHFVLTTNVDGQVPRAFDEDRVWLFQGDLRYLQCSQPCHDELIRDEQLIGRLCASTTAEPTPRISSDDLPRCPECHHLLTPWVRDTNFCEGTLWREQKARYEAFLQQHLIERGERVLFLELGVSSMTPAIIKLPFWDMCARNANAFYANVNRADASSPQQLGDRAMVITADLSRVTADLAQQMQTS
ncbi:MAG: hypothetical protein Q4B54_04995 [Coriobacteriales bacterium]|nr:hypothetical protein [Coriobacteriales bacterium]